MADFPIHVRIDPDKAGSDRVQRQLEELEHEARQLRDALRDSVSLKDKGASATIKGLGRNVAAVETRAASANARVEKIGRRVDDRGIRRINERLRETELTAGRVGKILRRAFVGLSTVVVARGFARLSDEFTRAQNLLKTVITDQQQLNSTFTELSQIANNTRTDLGSVVSLYQKGSIAANELGASNRDLLQFVEAVGKNLAIQGSSAEDARGALLQLSQSLGQGVVRGEEFNAVMEGAFTVAQSAARGIERFGGSVSKLRGAIIKGQVTSQEYFRGIIDGSTQSAEQFEATSATIGNSLTILHNSLVVSIGRFNEVTGASTAIAKSFQLIGNNIPVVATAVGSLAAIMGGQLAARSLPAATKAMRAFVAASGPLALIAVSAAGVAVIFEQIGEHARRAQERLREMEERGRAAGATASLISNVLHEIALLDQAIASQQARGADASDSQVAKAEKLKASLDQLRSAFHDEAIAARESGKNAAEAAKAQKEQEKALKRQAQLLIEVADPMREFNQLQADLNTLLVAGKISQSQFNAAVEKSSANASKQNPFEKQLDSIEKQNAALRVKTTTQDDVQKLALVELALQEKLVGLSQLEKILVREQYEENVRLTAEFEKQAKAKRVEETITALRDQVEITRTLVEQGPVEAEIRSRILALRREELKVTEAQELAIRKNVEAEAELAKLKETGQRRDSLRQELNTGAQLRIQRTDLIALRDKELQGQNKAFEALVRGDIGQAEFNQTLEESEILIGNIGQAMEDMHLRQLEGSNELGAGFERAFIKMKRESEDLASAGEAVANVFADRATDALVEFAQTGKLEFNDLAQSILADIQRILIRMLVVAALSAALGPAGGAAGGAVTSFIPTGRARGGPVKANEPVIVGERQPEVFVPRQSGTIVPSVAEATQQAPPQVNLQAIVVQDPAMVPQALSSGDSDDVLVIRLGANKDRVRSALGIS